jgi:hypothetical protein
MAFHLVVQLVACALDGIGITHRQIAVRVHRALLCSSLSAMKRANSSSQAECLSQKAANASRSAGELRWNDRKACVAARGSSTRLRCRNPLRQREIPGASPTGEIRDSHAPLEYRG